MALYGFDRDAHFAYIDKIIGRFRNPYLCDDVTRVGREPLRKLSAGDRLVRPILTARRYGIGTPDLLLGVGAALHYDNPEDVQSVEMRRLVEKEGVKAALARIASLPDTDPLLPLAAQATTKWNVSSPKSPKHNEKTEPPSPAPGRMLRRRAARVRPGPDTARRADRVDRRTASLFHL